MLHEEKKKAIKMLYADGKLPAEELDEEGNRWPTEQALVSAKLEKFTDGEGWLRLEVVMCTLEYTRV
jgi:hypothetical protein